MILLDTCPLLWLAIEPDRLSTAPRKGIAAAGEFVYVAAITAWEIAWKHRPHRPPTSGDVRNGDNSDPSTETAAMTDWKRKLAAYLHDAPSKALDITTHGERSDSAFHRAGFIDAEVGDYFKSADHTGAAADRLPFPSSQASGLRCAFDGMRNAFRHPLRGDMLPFHAEFKSAEQGIEGEESVQPLLAAESLDALSDDNTRWRARFFAHWRLWPKHAIEKDYRLALLPADTRIPDHSI